jgi:hypothetical protein
MASNKRRRSSDSTSTSSSKFVALQKQQPPNSMFISLPEPRIPTPICSQMKRRSPLTPPSVTPPSVSVSDSTTIQRPRDRCTSPRASVLLAKVAVVSATPGTVPSSPRLCAAASPDSNSNNSTPSATPPDEGCQFSFSSSKQLPESPNGGYVSFPMFEAFGGCDDREDRSVSPSHR